MLKSIPGRPTEYIENSVDNLILQDAFPMRFKGMHMINELFIISIVFPILKTFMKDKMKKRVLNTYDMTL